MHPLSLALLVGLVGLAAPALAESETHDGFYFNGQLGFGGSSIVIENSGTPDIEFDNGNGDFSIDLGLAVSRHVVVFGRLWTFIQTSPTAETAGVEIPLDDDVSVGAGCFGVGARYYFMPLNLYVGGSLGFATFSIQADGDSIDESESGFGVALEVGKEWWVSPDWAIGVGGRFSHAAANRDDEAGSITGDALGILFTATYN
jgi:Outer membrane protein beta-barrel domain